MSFLHLWPIFAGLAAAALPVAVHLLTKPRPAPYPLSTIRFVREAIRQNRARQRLRDWLILALRAAAVLLLAWAVARPIIGQRALVAEESSGDTLRVIVLDTSQSMAAEERGIARFERARAQAAAYLQYRSGLRANLIQAGETPRGVFDEPSSNLQALHDELQRSRVRPERFNVQAALSLAAEMLSRAPANPQAKRELVIVSDFQHTNWAAADFSVLPEDTRIQLESVATKSDAAPANLAILRAGCAGRTSAGAELQLEIEVANFTPAVHPVDVEVTLGPAVYRLSGSCGPWEQTTLTQPLTLANAGWLAGEARLVDVHDALAADNVRPFVVHVRPSPVYALLSRQPKGSSFYLERALAPFTNRGRSTAVRTVRVDPTQADAESLAAAELIALDHPGKLSPETIRTLASLVRRGRAMLYVASDPVDAVNLRQLTDALGQSMQMPVEFSPPPSGNARHDLFLTQARREQAPFSVYGDGVDRVLAGLRFSGGLASRRLDRGIEDDILAGFNDQSAALVVTAAGAGTLAVLNADLGNSNLGSPSSEAAKVFPVMIHELVERMLGQSQRNPAVLCGEAALVPLPPEAGAMAGLRILGPPGVEENQLGQLIDSASGAMWRTSPSAPPGVYQVERDGATVFALALELSPEESDLRAIDPEVITGRLAGGRHVQFHAGTHGQDTRDDLWTWLAVACIGCMLCELTALRIFRV